jgi:hypothetical protein
MERHYKRMYVRTHPTGAATRLLLIGLFAGGASRVFARPGIRCQTSDT